MIQVKTDNAKLLYSVPGVILHPGTLGKLHASNWFALGLGVLHLFAYLALLRWSSDWTAEGGCRGGCQVYLRAVGGHGWCWRCAWLVRGTSKIRNGHFLAKWGEMGMFLAKWGLNGQFLGEMGMFHIAIAYNTLQPIHH